MINFIGLIGLGFIVGALSGLFGVGGGFLLTPMLNVAFNIPYNIAVGSSLCQMIGTSAAGSLKHKSYGHIDYKLAGLTLMGSIGGAEIGARLLMQLKRLGNITIHHHIVSKMYLWVSVIYVILLLFVGISMFLESRKAKKRPPRGGVVETRFSQRIQQVRIPPKVSLPTSRISSISIWSIIGLGFGVGILSGLLGVGGGFIMSPSMIYLIGIPFTSGYGALTHFLKGNVNFTLVACILSGSLIGSQLGAMLNKRLRGAYVRYYFSWIVFISIGIILIKFLFNIGYLGS